MEIDPLHHQIKKAHPVDSVKKVEGSASSTPLHSMAPVDQVAISPEAEERLKIEAFVEKVKAMPDMRPQSIETALETQITHEAWAKIAEKLADGE